MTLTPPVHAPEDVEAALAPALGVRDRPPGSRFGLSAGRCWLLVLGAGVAWSVWGSGIGRQPTVNVHGWGTMREFWVAAARPDLSVDYLRTAAGATATTVAFALLGTVCAVVIGLVGGVLISETWWRSQAHASAAARVRRRAAWYCGRLSLGLPRGVHEAVWGLFLVNVLGRDPLVGVLAIAIPFGAITAKVFAELIDETTSGGDGDARASDAHHTLVTAGAGRLVAMVYGVLPRTWPDLVSYGFYRFDCSIRSAVILGMIGAGGLGFELALTFQALAYQQMWTLIYALVLLGAVVDWWGATLRSRMSRRRLRLSVAVGAALTVASAVYLAPDLSRLVSSRSAALLGELVRAAWPPHPPSSWADLLRSSATTLQMSLLAIAVGGALGVAVAFVAARRPGGGPRAVVAAAARLLLLVTRAISPPVWALVLLFVLFPGPLPGAAALGVYNFGVLGRLFAEVVENLDDRPAAALRSSGASALAAFLYASLPMALNRFAAYSLYRWEIAIRETVVVGVVGASGLGRVLEERRAAFDYPSMLSVVIALVVLSLLVDLASASARRAWR
jgi:phosphonate transport system permease protein